MKNFILSFALFFTVNISFAQSKQFEKLDNYFDTLEAHDKFMGSVAVSKDGKIIYQKAIGYCSIEDDKKATEKSIYRIGSISKTFTTVMVFKAIEAGKLKLDQTIDTYFPKIKNAKDITIDLLLHHRSGIHSFTNDENYLDWSTEAKTEKELMKIIRDGGSDFKPNAKAEYSNSNFLLLTFILEDIYGKSYSELLEEQITKPLELKNTYFGKKIDPADEECYSYQYVGGWDKNIETDMSVPLGAGAIVSTPTDLTKFSDALFAGKLVSEESLEQMMEIKDNYGRGLFVFPFYGKTAYGHTGGIDAFSSSLTHFPEEKVSYAIITNGSNFDMNQISIAVLSALFDREFEIPSFTSYNHTEEQLEMYTGTYSSEEFPLKITVRKDGDQLFAQGEGQPEFPLSGTKLNEFAFNPAGVEIVFSPEEETMLLKQGGKEFTFSKQN